MDKERKKTVHKRKAEKKTKKHTSKRNSAKNLNTEDIKKYFNMYCDICFETLGSLKDAISHHKLKHNQVGYIMCCQKKFFKTNRIAQHCMLHENPEAFK